MSRLAELQQTFQQCLLDPGCEPVSPWVRAGGRAAPARQLGAYVHAYAARLQEVLAADYPALQLAVGDEVFADLSQAYLRARPSRHFSLREFGAGLADFVAEEPMFGAQPWLAELARFEWALGRAFDAADTPLAGVADMAGVAPEAWPKLRLDCHPSVQRLDLAWNVVAMWRTLTAAEPTPLQAVHGQAEPWLIWRDGMTSRFRSLPADEAVALDALRAGENFGGLCQRLTELLDDDAVPLRAATLLKSWIAQGLIGRVHAP